MNLKKSPYFRRKRNHFVITAAATGSYSSHHKILTNVPKYIILITKSKMHLIFTNENTLKFFKIQVTIYM